MRVACTDTQVWAAALCKKDLDGNTSDKGGGFLKDCEPRPSFPGLLDNIWAAPCAALIAKFTECADPASLQKMKEAWEKAHHTYLHKECNPLLRSNNKAERRLHDKCRRVGIDLTVGSGKLLNTVVEAFQTRIRPELRPKGSLRQSYEDATLVLEFFSPSPPQQSLWYHISFLNLTTLEGCWVPMVENTEDSLQVRAAAAVHCKPLLKHKGSVHPQPVFTMFQQHIDASRRWEARAWRFYLSQAQIPENG